MKKETIQYEEIEAGAYSGVGNQKDAVIQDQEDWSALWSEFSSNVKPAPELPEINFEEELVIACFVGYQNSGGHSIEIKQVYKENGKLVIVRNHIAPGKNCIVTMAITQPYCMIKIPKTEFKSVSFDGETIQNDC